MKQYSLVLNIVLLIAVAILFYLHFSGRPAPPHPLAQSRDSVSNFRIAYFEMDSLTDRYVYMKDVREDLQKKNEDASRQVSQAQAAYMKRVNDYQQKAAAMTPAEKAGTEQQLLQQRAELENLNKEKQQSMEGEQMRRLLAVRTRIQQFLKNYSRERGYIFVYGSNETDNLYYKDSVRNITADLIAALNDDYKKDHK